MDASMRAGVSSDIFQEMNLGRVSCCFLCFLDDRYRRVITVVGAQLASCLFFSGWVTASAYHDVSIANVSKPRQQV
jgi:hypothetical protein